MMYVPLWYCYCASALPLRSVLTGKPLGTEDGYNLQEPNVSSGSRPSDPVATNDFYSSIRKRSSKVAQAPFRRPARPQHPQRRDQDGVRLLLPSARPAGPSQCPPAHIVLGIGHPGAVDVLSGWCLLAPWSGGEQATLLLRVDADLRAPD
jgi:hypothetical protein